MFCLASVDDGCPEQCHRLNEKVSGVDVRWYGDRHRGWATALVGDPESEMKSEVVKNILFGLGGVVIGVILVALLFYAMLLRKVSWAPSGDTPPVRHVERISK